MSVPSLRCLVLSDFTSDNFIGYLANDPEAPAMDAYAGPFGQVSQVLLDPGHACWTPAPDVTVVWTRPQAVIESFGRLMDGEPVAVEALFEEVDAYVRLLVGARSRAGSVMIPTWVLPPHERGPVLLQMRPGLGFSEALMRMNLRLAEQAHAHAGVHVLDAQRWVEAAGKTACNPKLWYMAKIAFGPEVFQAAARELKAALRGLRGQAKKLVIVDLDETLWGGLVGEQGWEALTLGGHDPAGEAYADFQRALKALSRRGIVLGIVSKNDEAVALQAIAKHPEMVLRQEDFAGWRINWNDKAQNVAELVEELNVGLQSVVFIDDHPAEQARVREALPEVLVPEWPADPMLFVKTLNGLGCFETATVSQEDRQRTRSYVTERQRTTLKTQVGSVEEWLKTLELAVAIDPLTEATLPRAAQLLNKTNQMNLTTRRMTDAELLAWARQPNHQVWTVHVADRFGSSGLTGLLSLERDGTTARIVDFVLSCRVMGRKVEEAMAAAAVAQAQAWSLPRVEARYQPTAKNKPCLEFWQRSGFTVNGDASVFEWETQRAYPFPEALTVTSA